MRSHQGSSTRTCRILRRQKRDARWHWKCRRCSESASPRILRTSLLFWLQMRRAGSPERASRSMVGRNSKIYEINLQKESSMKTTEENNKKLVLKAFDTLFNKRAYAAAERYWSPDYIQHSAHIEPGRDGLFKLIKSMPPKVKYEPGTIVAEGEFVIVHGRFSDFGEPVNWISADIVRIKDGLLVEHWDVIQDEATQEQSKSGQPMFGDTFGR